MLLLAAGEGTRFGDTQPKAFATVGGLSLVHRSAIAIDASELVDVVVVAVPKDVSIDRAREELGSATRKELRFVTGGDTRQASARAALDAAGDPQAILVHDAARALAPASLFDAVLRELDECEAVVPALPLADTVKETDSDHVVATLDRSVLVAVQTPQGFRTGVYRRAHEAADADGFVGTDDAALVERLGVRVRIIPGHDRNMKITTKHDAMVAEALLGAGR